MMLRLLVCHQASMINEDPHTFHVKRDWFDSWIVIKDCKISSCQRERIFFYSNKTPELSAEPFYFTWWIFWLLYCFEYARILTRVLTGDGLQMNRWKSWNRPLNGSWTNKIRHYVIFCRVRLVKTVKVKYYSNVIVLNFAWTWESWILFLMHEKTEYFYVTKFYW